MVVFLSLADTFGIDSGSLSFTTHFTDVFLNVINI
jgi:hypothetical protein